MEPTGTLLMGDEVINTIPARETDEFIKSSVDDFVPIPRESEVTSDSVLECDMPATTPFPPTNNGEADFDINSPLGMSDEPLGDDTKPRSFDVTFSNPLFNFNDDFTLCNDNLLFKEEFKDINIDLLLGEQLYTLSTRDKEIDFNPIRDIEELERLLANDLVLVPRAFDDPLGNSNSMSRSIVGKIDCNRLNTGSITVKSGSNSIVCCIGVKYWAVYKLSLAKLLMLVLVRVSSVLELQFTGHS
ncbi:hypothetical protein Tco_0890575 [Tanacetum coccineum]|uniref:Reverse transcriptase domain-containing protein n=1 Tax=Tanacetum coccineum TaxID=301880 RepID=A0ABQ5C3N3_9ASTR